MATSDPNAKSAELIKYYGKRCGIENYFLDTKDLRFGMGMDAIHTKRIELEIGGFYLVPLLLFCLHYSAPPVKPLGMTVTSRLIR